MRGLVRELKKLLFLFLPCFSLISFSNTPLKVGLVLDKGGKDDKSFNASAFLGATEAKQKFGFQLKVLECSSDSALTPSIRTFAQHGYNLIIGIGFVQQSPIEEVAKQFPKTHFLLVDAPSDLPNVRSVIFNEHEGSYLVGTIAALSSKTGTVGFIGGMDIPLIRRFEWGYRAGVKSISPQAKMITHFVGTSSDAWRNPSKAKELALVQFSKNADVSFCAAGASCSGVFDAAEEMKRFAIGVDSNQNWVKPGFVLTSMVKGVNLAVFQAIESEINGSFQAGRFSMGLADGAISFSVDEYNRSILTPTVEKKANEIRSQIIKGQIRVPDYYQEKKAGTHK